MDNMNNSKNSNTAAENDGLKEAPHHGGGRYYTPDRDLYNRQLDRENNNSIVSPSASSSMSTAECRLFINPHVFSDYAIDRYIDASRTVSSATSTMALGQDSWTLSVSPFSHSDLTRSASGGGYGGSLDNGAAIGNGSVTGNVARGSVGCDGPPRSWQYPTSSKFKFLRSKFLRNRRNKLNRLSNKIAENTESSAYIRAENGFQHQTKILMQPQTAVAAASVLVAPKVKPKVSKASKPPVRNGLSGGGGACGGGAGRGGGDMNDPMMRRPRRRVSSDNKQLKREQEEWLASLLSPEKYESKWYL